MTATETAKRSLRGPRVWPLSVQAYHALGESGLIPEKTELLYGQISQHRLLSLRLLEQLRAYARAGVKETWLVLAPEKQIELYLHPEGEQFREKAVHGPGGRVASAVMPRFAVDLDELFRGV